MPDEYFEFKTFIYNGELNRIAGWVEEYPELETGGQLFGFWTPSGFPVIQVAIGPGKKAKHTPISFFQDKDYLEQTGGYLNSTYGLQHIGEWHSHHTMGLETPSGGDSEAMLSALANPNLPRFLLCIANIYPANKQRNHPIKSLQHEAWTIKIGCFLYTLSSSGYKTGRWVLLLGESEQSPFCEAVNNECIIKHGLEEPRKSESCSLSVNDVPLDAPTFELTQINVSENQWYATSDGKKLFKGIYIALTKNLNDCKMFRNDSEQLYFMFERNGKRWKIEFPDNFPQEWAILSSDGIAEISLTFSYKGKQICKRVYKEVDEITHKLNKKEEQHHVLESSSTNTVTN
jgi:hypothetical protein